MATQNAVNNKPSGAFTLPNADGTSGQVLQTNGAGVVSFATASGAPGTWNSYTPTFTNQGTPTAIDAKWVDLGKSLLAFISWTGDNGTAAEMRISLPAGKTIATLTKPLNIGLVTRLSGSGPGGNYQSYNVLAGSGLTYFTFGSSASPMTNINGNVVQNAGDHVSFVAIVPLA